MYIIERPDAMPNSQVSDRNYIISEEKTVEELDKATQQEEQKEAMVQEPELQAAVEQEAVAEAVVSAETAPKEKLSVKKIILISAASAVLIAAIVLFLIYGLPALRYSGGVKAYDRGDYERAVSAFSALGDYKESGEYLKQAELGVHYANANRKVQSGEYEEAIAEYKNAKQFRDTRELLQETYVLYGDSLLAQGKYDAAVKEYRNAKRTDKMTEAYTLKGENLLAQGKYDDAVKEYRNAKRTDKVTEAYNLKGEDLFGKKQYAEAAEAFAAAENQERQLACGMSLVEEQKDYAAAVVILQEDETGKTAPHLSYANAMLSLEAQDYRAALEHFQGCAGLLDADVRQTEVTFLLAEKCLYDGYLNKAKALYTSLPEGYTQDNVAVADRMTLLNNNQKFLDLVGSWRATDTYFRVQADSTTSSYYYYWYYDDLNLGTVTVTCPYNDDGTFTVQGTATFPSYQNFSSRSSELKIDLENFHFSKSGNTAVPRQVDSSSTTKLTFDGRQFKLDYKFVNKTSNVYWHYTYTSKVTYGTRSMLSEDR